jgi:quaternary ammonium compound-resistance protein SugE
MAWIVLFAAGLFEVVWAFAMKQSEGFTRLPASIVTVVAMVASVVLLGWAMRILPLGTAYAVWTGIGAVGSFLLGILVLGEAASAGRLIAAAMIVGGLVLMKMSTTT